MRRTIHNIGSHLLEEMADLEACLALQLAGTGILSLEAANLAAVGLKRDCSERSLVLT